MYLNSVLQIRKRTYSVCGTFVACGLIHEAGIKPPGYPKSIIIIIKLLVAIKRKHYRELFDRVAIITNSSERVL